MDAMTKSCSRCGDEKRVGCFYKNKMGKLGLSSWCKECFNENQRNYRKRPEVRAKRRQESRSETAVEYRKKYRASEQGKKVRTECEKRRQHASRAGGKIPKEFKLMEHCPACFSTDNLQIEHTVPVSRGGTNELSNLTTLCAKCNMDKGALTYKEWILKDLQRMTVQERDNGN
jgi:5-methylcytosine-specific restriction endonuclease McrA